MSKTEQFCETSSFFWAWQHPKRSNSARLPHFSKCKTSKMKNSARLPSKMESWVQSWQTRAMRFAIFQSTCLKYCACHGKLMPGHTKWCTCHAKSANLHIWYSKMQPLSGNQRPDLLTSLMNMSFVLRLPRKCIFADPLQMSHACHRFWKCYNTLTFWSLLTKCTIPCTCHAKRHLNLQKWSVHGVFCTFWLGNVLRATTACTFSTSQVPKVVRTPSALYILTSKCASRHNGVHFFDISTSKSAPSTRCFVHFDLEMCFAPQRRAIFHLSSGQLAPHPPL